MRTQEYLLKSFPCIWEIFSPRHFFLRAKLTVRPQVSQPPLQLGMARMKVMFATSQPGYKSSHAWSSSFTPWHEADQQSGLESRTRNGKTTRWNKPGYLNYCSLFLNECFICFLWFFTHLDIYLQLDFSFLWLFFAYISSFLPWINLMFFLFPSIDLENISSFSVLKWVALKVSQALLSCS